MNKVYSHLDGCVYVFYVFYAHMHVCVFTFTSFFRASM